MFAVAMATKRQYLKQLESITRRLLELEKEVSVLLMADGHHLRLALDDLMTRQEGAEIMGVSLRQFDRICAKYNLQKIKRGQRTYYKRGDFIDRLFIRGNYLVPDEEGHYIRKGSRNQFDRLYKRFFEE